MEQQTRFFAQQACLVQLRDGSIRQLHPLDPVPSDAVLGDVAACVRRGIFALAPGASLTNEERSSGVRGNGFVDASDAAGSTSWSPSQPFASNQIPGSHATSNDDLAPPFTEESLRALNKLELLRIGQQSGVRLVRDWSKDRIVGELLRAVAGN